MQIHCKSIANPLQIHCKSILIALLFSFISFHGFSQNQECGTEDPTEAEMQALPWYGNNAWLDQFADSLAQSFSGCENCRVEGGNEVWYRVPVQFYVWSWQGQNTLERNLQNTDKTLKAMMYRLNDAMQRSKTPIRFYMLCPAFPEHSVAATGTMNTTDACNLRRNNWTLGALNCHIVNILSDATGVWCGRSDNNIIVEVAVTTDRIIEYDEPMPNINNSTFVHEVGHWLGLNHTHLFDGVPCLKEPVSRGVFSSACNVGVPVRHCERRGDALCDTPADPNLRQHENDIMADCSWFTNIRDDRGDFYAPDTRNYMSYSRNFCRNSFTQQQRAVMLRGINNQTGFFHVNTTNDFDIYEPDNVPAAASRIQLNETQIHSFSEEGSCGDDSDWLKFRILGDAGETIGFDLVLEITAVAGYSNPVGDVEFWRGNDFISPNPTTRLAFINQTNTGSTINYKISCNLQRNNTYLFRIIRNGNQTGRYKVTLKGLPSNASILGNETVCGTTTYRISPSSGQVALPLTWQVSSNLQIISGQGTSELSVVPIASNLSEWGFVRAVFNNTCTGQQEIHKSIWVGSPKILVAGYLPNNQPSVVEDTLYFQQACFGVVPPRPTYDKVCVSAQGASGVNTFEAEDIIGNASGNFEYSSGSQTCSGFLEEGYYEFRIRARNTQCSPVAYSDWILFKIWVIQTEPYCEPPPIEPPDVCYDEWGQAYLCPQGLRYFPNVSNGELNVEYNANYIKLELHSKYGQKVRETNLEKHKNKKLQLQDLPNDVYFLHLIDQNGNRVQKQVVLQK